MLFESDGKLYRFSFEHRLFKEPVLVSLAGGPKLIRAETHCYLVELPATTMVNAKPEPIKLADGIARCAAADVYDKEKGRVRSLRRALEIAWPEDRYPLWARAFNAYSHRPTKSAVSKADRELLEKLRENANEGHPDPLCIAAANRIEELLRRKAS
ncbi:MAG TPA: hypothetical protein VHA06_07060 [Candidatus Angelobacter sp.]|jgi:hypothetical protein|nr:hypothetical protein [Candidatus Angelobacter sp.]